MHAWLARVPKAELHLHLEGAIPLPALFELVQRHGGDPSVASVADIEAKFRFRDFPHFIEMWIWKNGFLRAYDDFAFIAEAMARELARQNVRYAEVFFSPELLGAPLSVQVEDLPPGEVQYHISRCSIH